MEFKTLFNYHGRTPSCKCYKTRQEYIYNKSTKKIEPSEVSNTYERIQSFYESTRIDKKLERYAFGDVTALGVPHGSYGDFSDVNTDLAQVLQAGTSASAEFSKLSPEIRKLFGDDSGQFLESLRDGSYESIITDYARKEVERLGSVGAAGDSSSQNQGGNS